LLKKQKPLVLYFTSKTAKAAKDIVAHKKLKGAMTVNKSMSNMITSAAVGMIAGTAAYMMSGDKNTQAKKLKRTAQSAVKGAGAILDGVSQMMK